MKKTILVYNNDLGVVEELSPLFEGENLCMVVLRQQKDLERMWKRSDVYLLIMDIPLGDHQLHKGLELITSLRKSSSVPIIVVSEEEGQMAKILALDAGADDYLGADSNPLELLARVKSQIRRYTQLVNLCENVNQIYKVDEIEVDDICRKVTVEGKEVKLTPIEYKILRLLVKEKGKVHSIDQIYESIWHMQAIGVENTVAVHIRHIRKKIEKNPNDPRYLKVVWGNGYKIG